ncbi:unnamed protein product [Aphanomyces euteiches]|nr:hypothetical protein Ae201684P_021800 [Aphanomyces euteiches]
MSMDVVTALVAIGTNLGDRAANLHRAIVELNEHCGRVVKTSRLYTTAPQYVVDQPEFLNAAVELSTTLSPTDLLLRFKDIEVRVGRDLGGLRYGPRILDVDLLFYRSDVIETTTAVGPLLVPHKLMAERDFVLRPLLDIAPDFVHPVLGQTMQELYDKLPRTTTTPPPPPVPVLSLGRQLLWNLEAKTYVMGILNVTPDSFSGDGKTAPAAIVESARRMIAAGADMLDIGGESTAPNAAPVSAQEELNRVLPVIQAIRAFSAIPISIDTTKSIVAAAAIQAGANLVNDVSGGTRDKAMLTTVAQLAVPIVLMHMRGMPSTMTQLKVYRDIVDDVGRELLQQVQAAQDCGIPTWNIIVDPGIGFAKGLTENLELLRRVAELRSRWTPCPLLIGASRKKFLGTICDQPDPAERGAATTATCAAAIAGGASIVRVHDVAMCVDACKVSDAIWRLPNV